MAVIMVEERFDPPIDLSQGSPVADKVSPCLPVYDVTWLSSYIAADGTRCVCVYEADNAEAGGASTGRRGSRSRTSGRPTRSTGPSTEQSARTLPPAALVQSGGVGGRLGAPDDSGGAADQTRSRDVPPGRATRDISSRWEWMPSLA